MITLSDRSKEVRRETLKLSKQYGGYHYGGSFSIVEILIELYDNVLTAQDKFVLSKGHACWAYYVLLRERGLSPQLEGHPCLDEENGVNFTTGSEGHGFPAAVGMSLARKITNKQGRIFVLIGDGECQEGTTWESLLMARQHKLDNLVVIVDFNRLQGAGAVDETLSLNRLADVAEILGWYVIEIDGHRPKEIKVALNYRKKYKPLLIIAHTVKGKGVSYMENKCEWHAKYPNDAEMVQAYKELK